MTATAFAAACLLDPWDDTPRLVMADWMDEHGQEDRAAVIRGQVELAKVEGTQDPDCKRAADQLRINGRRGEAHGYVEPRTLRPVPCSECWADLRAATLAILSRHTGDKATGERWDRVKCEKCDGTGEVGVQRSRSLRDVDVQCDVCGGTGDLAVRPSRVVETGGQIGRFPETIYTPHWDRGFLHLGCTLAEAVEERECERCGGAGQHFQHYGPDANFDAEGCAPCSGTGRIPTLTPWGRAALEAGVGVWLEGVEPALDESGWCWYGLPEWLYAPQFVPAIKDDYPSPDAAKLSLARAFTAFAARQEKESA